MSVIIKKSIDRHDAYSVNGKLIYQDGNGDWITLQEFTSQEYNAFLNFATALKNGEANPDRPSEYNVYPSKL